MRVSIRSPEIESNRITLFQNGILICWSCVVRMLAGRRKRKKYTRFRDAGTLGHRAIGHSGIELELASVSSEDDDEEEEVEDDTAEDETIHEEAAGRSDDNDGSGDDGPPDYGRSRYWIVRWAEGMLVDRDDEDEHPDDVEWERSGERDVCFLVTLGAGFVAITVIVLVYLEYG